MLAPALAGLLQAGAGVPQLAPYVAPSRLYALHIPAGWRVSDEPRPASLAITAGPADGSAEVFFYWAREPAPSALKRPSALDQLRHFREAELRRHPGCVFSELLVSRDGGRAAVTERYALAGTARQSRIFIETDGRKWSMQSYTAREAEMPGQRPLLMNVLMSLAFIKPPRGSTGAAGAPPDVEPLVERRADDGSVRMRVPRDWSFLAARGTVVTGAPKGGPGFIFTSFAGNPMLPAASVLQGVIGRPYMAPARSLGYVLSGFGHRDAQMLQTSPDPATVADYRRTVGRGCEAADLVAAWTAKDGGPCLGAFKVVNALPGVAGQWHSIVAGAWAPRAGFGGYLPALEEVARSFTINDAYAKRYIQSGLANLRRLQQQTAAAVQSLNYAREDMQKAWEDRQARKDYMDSKWDDYRRGDSYWVSDLEGGKVYHTDPGGTRDTQTGDYYEGGGCTWTRFEGRNPRHPSEDMREISSYELEHGPPPK
jgi:uncharacterized protein YbdZ (MbtH family)